MKQPTELQQLQKQIDELEKAKNFLLQRNSQSNDILTKKEFRLLRKMSQLDQKDIQQLAQDLGLKVNSTMKQQQINESLIFIRDFFLNKKISDQYKNQFKLELNKLFFKN